MFGAAGLAVIEPIVARMTFRSINILSKTSRDMYKILMRALFTYVQAKEIVLPCITFYVTNRISLASDELIKTEIVFQCGAWRTINIECGRINDSFFFGTSGYIYWVLCVRCDVVKYLIKIDGWRLHDYVISVHEFDDKKNVYEFLNWFLLNNIVRVVQGGCYMRGVSNRLRMRMHTIMRYTERRSIMRATQYINDVIDTLCADD